MCISPAPVIGAVISSEFPPLSSALAVTVIATSPRFTRVVGNAAERETAIDCDSRYPPQTTAPRMATTTSHNTIARTGRRRFRMGVSTRGEEVAAGAAEACIAGLLIALSPD